MSEEQKAISPFEEVKDMDSNKALNILFQAASAAQRAGILSIRDSVLLAASIEHFSMPLTSNEVQQEQSTTEEPVAEDALG